MTTAPCIYSRKMSSVEIDNKKITSRGFLVFSLRTENGINREIKMTIYFL